MEEEWIPVESTSFQPSRWWRVIDSEGVWCETSNEKEARDEFKAISERGGEQYDSNRHVNPKLFRLYERHDTEWRQIK